MVEPVVPGDASRVDRWEVEIRPEAAPEQSRGPDFTRVYLIEDGFGFSDLVSEAFRERGIGVESYPNGKALPSDADAVIFLKGTQIFHDLSDAIEINLEVFNAAKRVAENMASHGGTFVVVQNTGGSFGFDGGMPLRQAVSGGAAALVKTAMHEWPKANLKVIDLDLPEDASVHAALAARLVEEICCGGESAPVEIGLTGEGERITVEHLLAPLDAVSEQEATFSLGGDDVVLATGGARGVTAAALLELARRVPCKFILLGRTVLEKESPRVSQADTDAMLKKAILLDAKEARIAIKPADVGAQARRIVASREIRKHIKQFKGVGAQVTYLPVDILNTEEVRTALASLPESWRKISVLVHGAGIIADKRIEQKEVETFKQVFDTKVQGFFSVWKALPNTDLSGLVFFSSAAARSGNQGQVDYAMANEVLNKIAGCFASENPTMRVKSMGWGPWRGGMVSESLERYFESRGVEMIDILDGAAAFADELLGPSKAVEVLFGSVDFGQEPELDRYQDAVLEPSAKEITQTRTYSLEGYPWLVDHSVKGDALMPMVGVLDWFLEAVAELYGDAPVDAWELEDVKVLHGVRMDAEHPYELSIEGSYREERKSFVFQLKDLETKRDHYTATISPTLAPCMASDPLTEGPVEEWLHTVYDGEALFHQGVFQSLGRVFNIRSTKPYATLIPLEEAIKKIGPEGHRMIALDACLQLVLIWIQANMNGIALPMSVERMVVSTESWPTEGLRIHVTIRHRGANHTKADAEIWDASSHVLAELHGIESYIYKS